MSRDASVVAVVDPLVSATRVARPDDRHPLGQRSTTGTEAPMMYDAPDWCPPFGIPRPTVLPPDDAHQDALCAIRAAHANARADCGLAKIVGAGAGSDDGPGLTSPPLGGDDASTSVSHIAGRSPGPSHVRPAPTPTPLDDATTTPTAASTTSNTLPLLPVESRSSTQATSAGRVEDRTWTMWSDARL